MSSGYDKQLTYARSWVRIPCDLMFACTASKIVLLFDYLVCELEQWPNIRQDWNRHRHCWPWIAAKVWWSDAKKTNWCNVSTCVIESNISIFENTRNILIIIKSNLFDHEDCYRIKSYSIKKIRYLDHFRSKNKVFGPFSIKKIGYSVHFRLKMIDNEFSISIKNIL